MRRAIFFLALASSASAVVTTIGCQQEDRPPVSDGPRASYDAEASTTDASDGAVDAGHHSDGGILDPIVLLGYAMTGVVADGDTAYVTAVTNGTEVDAGPLGVVLRIDPDGKMTTIHTDDLLVGFPVKIGNTLAFLRTRTSSDEDLVALDLGNLSQAPKPLIQSVYPFWLSVEGTSIFMLRNIEASSMEVDKIETSGSSTTVTTILGDFGAGAIATNSSTVFIGLGSTTGGGLFSAPLAGGTASQIGSAGTKTFNGVAFDSGKIVYEAEDSTSSGLFSIAPTGGTPTPILANHPDPLYPFVLADGYVYFIDNSLDSPNVSSVPLDGSSGPQMLLPLNPATFVNGSQNEALAVGTSVIFVDNGNQLDRIVR